MQKSNDVKKRIHFRAIGGILISILLLFTFISKTVYNYNLPVVTGTTPLNGNLNKTETVQEIAKWANEIKVYTNDGGYVKDIFIEKGTYIDKGQPLLKLSQPEAAIAARKANAYELQQIDLEITNAETDLSQSKVLYEAGVLAQTVYEKEYRSLQTLYAKKQKNLLEGELMAKSDEWIVYAPDDMVVLEVSVHKGQEVTRGELIATCGQSEKFKLDCPVSLDNNFITEGDTCTVKNLSHTFEGTVTEVKPEAQKKIVTVSIQSSEVKPGETFEITFKKASVESYILVPNSAVKKDSNGYFLYQIKQREGMFGLEFYVKKLSVYIGDHDNENTIMTKGVTFFDPLVLLSDKPLNEGSTVILENEGDFFAK